MESDYDQKFEEMKKYVPFLENMIRKLENTSYTSTNPRQAQLDKIRSLRDLLLDKKKRMKMENLLKCEQVLINLYAKVEQKDTLPGIKKASEPLYPSDASTESKKSELNLARSKLKTVVSKLPENDPNTLPEIAPACETEVNCTPGSKEPALFQRRPNKYSRSPPRQSSAEGSAKKSSLNSVPKRNYTRVLVSPEPSPRRWTKGEDPDSDKPLFSRRSRKSPKKSSPQKKAKKMSSKLSKAKDFNIVLNVPQESIESLNTGDILSRIIKCPDDDVDIDTLRDIRTQILGELKNTGANSDISDLILKSYKKKKVKNKQKEVEEGELSDSESEAIESVYGSLVLLNDDKNKLAQTSTASTKKEKQARNIRLVINYNKQKESTSAENEVTDFEVFDIEKNEEDKVVEVSSRRDSKKEKQVNEARENQKPNIVPKKTQENLLTIEVEDDDDKKDNECKDSDSSYIDISSSDNDAHSPKVNQEEVGTDTPFKANFYKEHKQIEKNTADVTSVNDIVESPKSKIKENSKTSEKRNEIESEKLTQQVKVSNENKATEEVSTKASEEVSTKASEEVSTNSDVPDVLKINSTDVQERSNEKPEENVEIPLLNTVPVKNVSAKENAVSEIDILQALKNEILSDSIAIPGSDVATPLLHQPKVTKVASAQEIMTKKRISIEKYKEKSAPAAKQSLFLKDPHISQSYDNLKKTSLKLTEQEQQRFNLPPLALDSSDEDNETNYSFDDYADLAPQSPENNEKLTSGPSSPIIIPVEPVKPATAACKTDVDMRTLPMLSPNAPLPVPAPSIIPFSKSITKNKFLESNSENNSGKHAESRRPPLLDPRVHRDSKDSPNPHAKNSRPIEMTPSRQSFDAGDSSGRKHVYAPFPAFEPRDKRERSVSRDTPGPRWEPNVDPVVEDRKSRWDLWKETDSRDISRTKKWDDRDYRNRSSDNRGDYHKSRYDAEKYHSFPRGDTYGHEQKDDYSYSRMDCPRTPVHSFGRSECPTTPIHPFGRSDCPTTPSHPFGRTECPTTPIHPFGRNDGPVNHSFGRSEAPMTPSHPFGRSEAPMTPSHPFGRSEAPMTPSHQFGRSEAPMTPSHPFGRSEAPMTPSHPFGRSDAPMTPSHPFGRSEAPMTPSHPFGRSDAPMTPIHPFGRSETPMTPSHQFGRTEAPITSNHSFKRSEPPFGRADMGVAPRTPSHPFGRSDYQHVSGPKLVKDPRLHRSDIESKSRQYDEDKGGYYKDRPNPDLNKTYNRTDSYRNYRERTPGRESSISRKDDEHNLIYTRDRGISNECRRENDRGSKSYYEHRREYQRFAPDDERCNSSSSRGPCDSRTNLKRNNENTLSVKPQSGRSFTIDTSVNTTFQEFLNGKGLQVFDYSFNSRRQRAASVGRTLIPETSVSRNFRENSVGRTMPKSSLSTELDTTAYKRMVNFVRARSMGRELVDKREKTFKEVKAELRSYQAKYSHKEIKKPPEKKVYNRDPCSRKDSFEKNEKRYYPSHKKTIYSPRKNCRDPRMHRDPYSDSKNKSRNEDKNKHYGIVYSSDNIAKGILGSGYGVKNYKIPKIKKPVEDNDVKDFKVDGKQEHLMTDIIKCTAAKVKEKDGCNLVKQIPNKYQGDIKKDKAIKISKVDKKTKEVEIVNKSHKESTNKRTTRRSKLVDTTESKDETIKKTRKAKKAFIDSDSETDIAAKEMEASDTLDTSKKAEVKINHENDTTNKIEDSTAHKLNCNIAIDDLENIFTDNINSDPVLDNINALIANLDDDIDTTKAEDFTKEITFDKMFESIDSPENNMDVSLKDITDVIRNFDSKPIEIQQTSSDNNVTALKPEVDTIKQSIEKSNDAIGQLVDNQCQPGEKETKEDSIIFDVPLSEIPGQKQVHNDSDLGNIQDNTIQNSNQPHDTIETIILDNNEAVVSTSKNIQTADKNDEMAEDRPSTPDSTLNTSPVKINQSITSYDEEGLADSTNEKNYSHHDVLLTPDNSETSPKDAEISNKNESPVSSIGNLLSMLQDKSKIKELLSMLGEAQSGENEKLKKKLEKLSEIVSDDDTCDGVKDENIVKDIQNEPEVTETNADDSVKSDPNVIIKRSVEAQSDVAVTKEPHEPDTNSSVSAEDTTIDSEKNTIKKHNEPKNVASTKEKAKKVSLRKGRKGKRKSGKNKLPAKRVTRSEAANLLKKPKIGNRELKLLQESVKEMCLKDDILNATGIRMCRLAKLVDEKSPNQEEDSNNQNSDNKPVVLIEKIKENINSEEKQEPKVKKKPGPKPKAKISATVSSVDAQPKEMKPVTTQKYKPGPKSKTRNLQEDSDPFSFDDSVSEATTVQTSEQENESETEDDSNASSKSFGSTEVLADLKKRPKRKKRSGWSSGIIKKKKKKIESKLEEFLLDDNVLLPNKEIKIPDMNCFIDKSYCFLKNVTEYPCRLCEYNGLEIVKHYKTEHPHTEIPLSRMNAVVAREAVEQCEDVNFQGISKMPTEKYVCRFCFEEFGKKLNVLEEFFWHVVSMHTGEYKRLCSECVNVTRCPFNLDIPPPPKDLKGQLIGYICGRCNFTQISLENLKTHVIVRHNDEQTEVYTINLAVMSKKTIQKLMKRCNSWEQAQMSRTLRSKVNVSEISEARDAESSNTNHIKKDLSSKSPVRTKLSFENDDSIPDASNTAVKVEKEDNDNSHLVNINMEVPDTVPHTDTEQEQSSSDILDIPHFKISFASSGTKEYVCAINGNNHYKTNLLISMKKHVQVKHSEVWDGYCSVCKVIVMPQGEHRFKECLQHMLDKHIDSFPVLQDTESETDTRTEHPVTGEQTTLGTSNTTTESEEPSSQAYINVRSHTDLFSSDIPSSSENEEALPKIQSVVSLGTTPESQEEIEPERQPTIFKCPLSVEKDVPVPEEPYKYEEMQNEVMSKKHLVILESMLIENKLVQIFKCAGRYCSFTTDSPDAALLHASTHQRIGGENALLCSYCDYYCNNSSIDLVMHVFKMHGCCPFVCGRCFYRAVASQLVLAHIQRVHGGSGAVLQTETVSPGDNNSMEILPREVAVQHYVCGDAERNCRFKTYTHGKFIEHLIKHTPPYLCYVCSLETNTPTELVHHFKTHGLKLYQCTWCIEGGDNEGDFLAHSSARHPTRQPQAYLRIITNNHKMGGSKIMVLPLAKLNKSSVPTRVVTPAISANNPAREAEKSLEMEKLIAAMPSIAVETPQPRTKTPIPIPASQVSSQISNEEQITNTLEQGCSSRIETPPPSQVKNDSLATTPVLKTEPVDERCATNLSIQTVICLDSDEDEDLGDSCHTEKEGQTVIDQSEHDRTAMSDSEKNKKVNMLELYKCDNCKLIMKNAAGFRRHANSCYSNVNNYTCPHCSFTTDNLERLLHHYMGHSLTKSYTCGTCLHIEKNLYSIKMHIKKHHGLTNVSVTSSPDGNYVANGSTRAKPGPKRKLSGGSVLEIAPKRIRYGAQDLHKLPQKPILDELTYCNECEFSTKVRLNLVRHIQQHADNQLVPQTAPVNPVPHLETNEKHFDKMINLASSSVEIGRVEKSTPSVTLHIPPEAASRYPKYVPDRQRHTCGAKGCSYISLDEAMLKIHWETLHASSNNFTCVHCPPYQYLDTSKPLTASRIIAHLKMHDICLYACSACTYYHYRKQVLEKHLAEVHKGSGQLMVVREESTIVPTSGIQQTPNAAPTMDLKPWKCGLCAFKSMLRPEVIEHCSKTHNTKMQFKCPVCPFRTSTLENVTKHHAKSHPENKEDVFYYYYREGSIPDESDGTPRWVKQRQKLGNPEPEVKTEAPENNQQLSTPASKQPILPGTTASKYSVDLDIVKKELVDPIIDEPMVALCRRFGAICDPNGLKFKCPLCHTVTEDNKESMRSHLYEELQYRKWACSICCYKAFHKNGLNEHMLTEHRQNRAVEPIELDADTRVERWVNGVLDHQSTVIEANKSNLAKQKLEQGKPSISTTSKSIEKPAEKTLNEKDTENLIQAFGHLGAPNNVNFCCPKCEYQTADEAAMKDHLQIELNKIRWRCSSCFQNSQNYHEAQLHSKTCKSSSGVQAARPVEAIRDPAVRAAWLETVIRTQKLNMKQVPDPEPEPMDEGLTGPIENSLLVVRYEERVPTPEVEMIGKKKAAPEQPMVTTGASPDSDDERLVIDVPTANETDTPKKNDSIAKKCLYCPFTTKYQQQLDFHLLRHYNLKPLTCCYCEKTYYHTSMEKHMLNCHPNLPKKTRKSLLPSGPPLVLEFPTIKKQTRKRSSSSNEEVPKSTQSREEVKRDEGTKVICLVCETAVLESETTGHTHDKPTYFAQKGAVVVKCCVCLSLLPNMNIMQEHNSQFHPNNPINYAYFKLNRTLRDILHCGHCTKRFKYFRDLKIHHNVVHSALQLKYETRPYYPGAYDFECEADSKGESSKTSDNSFQTEPVKAAKRVARKSTSKLPSQTVARKSTTKLPFNVDSDSESEYSYYGAKPASLDQFKNVTTLMPIYNTTVPLQKLNEIIKINPVVLVKDLNK